MPSGELSAWQHLMERCRLENVRIIELYIRHANVLASAIPNAEGYFQGHEMRISNLNTKPQHFQGVGTVVGNQIFITWISDYGQVIQDVRPLEKLWVHTDKRQLVDLV